MSERYLDIKGTEIRDERNTYIRRGELYRHRTLSPIYDLISMPWAENPLEHRCMTHMRRGSKKGGNYTITEGYRIVHSRNLFYILYPNICMVRDKYASAYSDTALHCTHSF